MKDEKDLNVGLFVTSLANIIIGLFIVDILLLKCISFAIASICIGLIPSSKIWNCIILCISLTLIFVIYMVYEK